MSCNVTEIFKNNPASPIPEDPMERAVILLNELFDTIPKQVQDVYARPFRICEETLGRFSSEEAFCQKNTTGELSISLVGLLNTLLVKDETKTRLAALIDDETGALVGFALLPESNFSISPE